MDIAAEEKNVHDKKGHKHRRRRPRTREMEPEFRVEGPLTLAQLIRHIEEEACPGFVVLGINYFDKEDLKTANLLHLRPFPGEDDRFRGRGDHPVHTLFERPFDFYKRLEAIPAAASEVVRKKSSLDGDELRIEMHSIAEVQRRFEQLVVAMGGDAGTEEEDGSSQEQPKKKAAPLPSPMILTVSLEHPNNPGFENEKVVDFVYKF